MHSMWEIILAQEQTENTLENTPNSVKWHIMLSEFTWIIKSFVTLITIKINCDNCDKDLMIPVNSDFIRCQFTEDLFFCDTCDKWFNEEGTLRHHKVSKVTFNRSFHILTFLTGVFTFWNFSRSQCQQDRLAQSGRRVFQHGQGDAGEGAHR